MPEDPSHSRPTVCQHHYKPRNDGTKMKALVFRGKEKVAVEDVPVPDITQPDDVILQITGTTICGSDLHLYHGEIPDVRPGDILGHEFMGKVERVGPNVKKLQAGQRVVCSFQIVCGECRYCKEKLSTFCDRTNSSALMENMYGHKLGGLFGYSHMTGGYPGGQAEYVRVPLGEKNLLPLPDDVPEEKALYLSDVVPTAYHTIVDTGVKKGDVVGIWGMGPVGQCAAKWAQLKGASRVIVIDTVEHRLSFASDKLGVEAIDTTKDKDIVQKLKQMVPDGLDVAIDSSSTFREPKTLTHKTEKSLRMETDASAELHNAMLMCVRKMGSIGIIGDQAYYTNHFNIGALMEKGIRFIGNGQAPVHKYWEEILNDYIKTGKFDPSFMVTHRCPIEDIATAYKKFDSRMPGLIKIFCETRFSPPPSPGCPQATRASDW